MIDELKNDQLNEEEISDVVGGNIVQDLYYGTSGFLINYADRLVWESLTVEEKNLIRLLPDRAAKRAKMYEFHKQKG